MVRTNLLSKMQFFALSVMANFFVFLAKAQNSTPDLKVDVNVDKGADAIAGGDWMSNPLIWVIGALVLIVIVALVARGGGSKF